jgi:hypothetical protein
MNMALYNHALASKTVQRKEESYPLTGPVDPENWVVGSLVELARIYMPFQYYNEIVRIDTLVQDITTGQPLGDWDNPHDFDGVFDFCLGYNMIQDKVFQDNDDRFVSYVASSAPWFNVVGCSPFPILVQWGDNRYAWGNPSNDMRLASPGDIAVRLFAYCKEATEYRHKVQGRLIAEWSALETEAGQWRAQR